MLYLYIYLAVAFGTYFGIMIAKHPSEQWSAGYAAALAALWPLSLLVALHMAYFDWRDAQ